MHVQLGGIKQHDRQYSSRVADTNNNNNGCNMDRISGRTNDNYNNSISNTHMRSEKISKFDNASNEINVI